MNFTETWYNNEIKGYSEMKGYKLYRGTDHTGKEEEPRYV